jgi:pseudouridine kinase
MPEKKVLVIGASIIDLTGNPEKELIWGDSCSGKIHFSHGGVGRNIAENIQRLGIQTHLMTALGNDLFGKKIQFDCQNIGINLNSTAIDDELPTPVYLLVNNHHGDIEFGISDIEAITILDKKYLLRQSKLIDEFENIVLETNLLPESIDFITSEFKNKTFFLDLVTRKKAEKVKDFIGRFYAIKPNVNEAEVLTDIIYENPQDLLRMRDFFLKKGCKKIFITLGKQGSFFADDHTHGFVPGIEISAVSSSGAGDSYSAGIVFSHISGKTTEESALFGTGAAIASLLQENASNPRLSETFVNGLITKYNICTKNI